MPWDGKPTFKLRERAKNMEIQPALTFALDSEAERVQRAILHEEESQHLPKDKWVQKRLDKYGCRENKKQSWASPEYFKQSFNPIDDKGSGGNKLLTTASMPYLTPMNSSAPYLPQIEVFATPDKYHLNPDAPIFQPTIKRNATILPANKIKRSFSTPALEYDKFIEEIAKTKAYVQSSREVNRKLS
jgi:hypothetical protein